MELTAWTVASTAPGLVDDPEGLGGVDLDWIPFTAPGTVAAALATAGRWSPRNDDDFDASDWWFRCDFDHDTSGSPDELDLGGIATLADVWLNGHHVLHSVNMFRRHRVPATGLQAGHNQLVIRCASLRTALGKRRPRPRWKTNLVAEQNLRWFRTTLHGRRPNWTGRFAPVGPWRPVTLSAITPVRLDEVALTARVGDGTGLVGFRADLLTHRTTVTAAALVVGDHRADLELSDGGRRCSGTVEVPEPEVWWPATHGGQPLYPVRLDCDTGNGPVSVDLGHVGFRTIDFGTPEAPRLSINGTDIFCRGACWVPLDPIGLTEDPDALRSTLEQFRSCGFNMVRINGTAVHESAAFFDLCDELGLLVWNDLMFARMDYPVDDPGFLTEVRAEVGDVVRELQGRPSVAVVCGGTEIGQQAAMLGQHVDPETLIGAAVRDVVTEGLPDTPFLLDAPIGGTRPFTVDTGVSFYFGVGGYRRPLSDARTAAPRFAAECLAFSIVPCQESVDDVREQGAALHDGDWKRGIARDLGGPWDTEDVRDHYVAELFGVDPVAVRSRDPEHYLDLGRAAVNRAMAATMAEWRRPDSPCGGAIILEARDCRDGAGPGLIDVAGRPKSALYALSRVLQPATLLLSDEGLNGLVVWALNDAPDRIDGHLRVRVFTGDALTAEANEPFAVNGHSHVRFDAEGLLGQFIDITYAYRFGPTPVTAVSFHWHSGDRLVARAVHHPALAPLVRSDVGLAGTARLIADGRYGIEVTSRHFAQNVMLEGRGITFSDDAFDIEPGGSVRLEAVTDGKLRVRTRALNGTESVPIVIAE